jgi:mono/diheme cytochrome c family protein
MTPASVRNGRIAALAFGLVLLSAASGASAEDALPRGDASNGRRLFLADGCFACHGRMGQGGAFNAGVPMLAGTQLPQEAVTQALREPSGDMPTYSERIVSAKDAADIYAYLKSLQPPPQAKDLPAILRR